uniref:CCHC-type domain-containing protein n=1 Tax=Fagus sylvatica TaxID=28930 RepID=A0A2N9EH95_FAGSY
MMLLWNEKEMMDTDIAEAALGTIVKMQQSSCMRHFLMKLRPEFEPVRVAILNQGTKASLDNIIVDLLAEETRKGRALSIVQCHFCHEMGYVSKNCRKRNFCNYCKEKGHVLSQCSKRPQYNAHSLKAYLAVLPTPEDSKTTISKPPIENPSTSAPAFSLSPEILQQDLHMGKVIGRGYRKGELFVLDFGSTTTSPTCFLVPSTNEINSTNNSWRLWHCRLGHPHSLNSIFSSGVLDKLDHQYVINKTCESCALAKAHTLPFSRSLNHASSAFDIVHSDVWGPPHFNKKIEIFRFDSRGEYIPKEVKAFLAAEGIVHQCSCTEQPQQNGVAEPKHRHIQEMARALRLHANLPKPLLTYSRRVQHPPPMPPPSPTSTPVYMRPPPGSSIASPHIVCKLHKALFGLKQAPQAWFAKLKSVLIGAGFRQSENDYSLFISSAPQDNVFILVYADDILITRDDSQSIINLKNVLQHSFQMKDLGSASYFLGLEISRNSHEYFLSQQKYTQDLINLVGLTDDKQVDTPLEVNVKYSKNDGEPIIDPTLYRIVVGSLVYLTITHPDIAHAVQLVSQFVSDPRRLHLTALHRIIRYLRSTFDLGLPYYKSALPQLQAYSDVDYGGCPDTRRSTTIYCSFLGSSLLSWKSKKQPTVSKSSTEAKYRAMSTVCSEIVWLCRLLADFGMTPSIPTPLFCDNESVVKIASNPVFHERNKTYRK